MTGRAVPAALAILAVAAQIVYPLVFGATRDAVTIVVVLALAAAALTHAWSARGGRWALALFAITAGLGFVSEMVGTATGFPFGCYDYTAAGLGPSLAGVPLVVPLAWTAGCYPVWCAVAHVVDRTRPGGRIALAAVGIVGWDLFLDPQMVADGQWRWCSTHAPPPGLAIPWTNYLGWLLVAVAMAAVLTYADARLSGREPSAAADAVPLALFLWTWLGSALAHAVFLGPQLRWSALYGLVGMGVVGVPLLTRLRREARHGDLHPPPRRAEDPPA